MLTLPPTVRVYVAIDPVDMRKSHHGLAAVAREQLALDPLSGHLIFFRNRRGNLMKLLWFDRNGLALLYKRLESGTFELPKVPPGVQRLEVDPAQLAMILEGIELKSAVRRRRYRRPPTRHDES